MNWIHRYQLFLFDFDGLLVDSESLHYQAFMSWMESCGCPLDWSFLTYCAAAHESDTSLKKAVGVHFPELEKDWNRQYQRKKEIYWELLVSSQIPLMKGALELLSALDRAQIQRCVITNSPKEQVALIRSSHPILETIPHWITREMYEKPKPHPESYLRAIELYGREANQIIGFEDSFRGIQALRQTPAHPVMICSGEHPQLAALLSSGISHFASLQDIPKDWEGG